MSSPISDPPSLPAVQTAVVEDGKGKPKVVNNAPLPELSPGDLLVKTAMVALNPCDYKFGAAWPSKGAVIGTDFVGTVVRIQGDSKASSDIHIGDTVCGLVHGSNPADTSNGAFAEYLRVPSDLVLKVPAGFKLEDAAAMGLGLATAGEALWESGLNLEVNPDKPAGEDDEKVPVLVYGASTATGTMAMQLLRLSGMHPIVATCSPRNFDLVRSYGASTVFDYADTETAAKIKEETGGELEHALDTITDADSVACCQASISRFGGCLTCLELCPDELRTRRAVEVKFPNALEIFGKELQFLGGYERPASEEKRAAAVKRFEMYQRLLDQGALKAHPVKVLPPGFESIINGLKVLKSGSVSGYKLVVPLA